MSMRVAVITTDSRDHFKEYDLKMPYFGTAPQALLEGFGQIPELEVHILSCIHQAMESPAKLGDNIWYHGLPVSGLGWLKTGYQGCIRAVRKKLKEISPDLVHGQGTERDCAIDAVLSGYPNVLTIHGNMRELARIYGARFPQYPWFAAHLEGWALRRTEGVFCNSAHTEAQVLPLMPRVWRVPNPLRSAFFTPLPPRKPRDIPVILNIGSVTPWKRQNEILDLARDLHEKGVKFRLEFIGSCSESVYALEFQEKLASCQDFAVYRGFFNIEELIGVLDGADALLHFPREEAFGLVVAEGIARGLKFFGSQAGGLIDITRGVPGAELVGIDDWQGLGLQIEQWINKGFPRSAEGVLEMKKRYAPEVIARKHVEIYREMLSS